VVAGRLFKHTKVACTCGYDVLGVGKGVCVCVCVLGGRGGRSEECVCACV